MYSSSGNGKTMIKVGGNDKSKVEPLYSVPIQTTATLNIQLLPQRVSSTSVTANQSVQSGKVTSVRTAPPPSVAPTRFNIVAEVPPPTRRSSGFVDDASSSLGTQTEFNEAISYAGGSSNPANQFTATGSESSHIGTLIRPSAPSYSASTMVSVDAAGLHDEVSASEFSDTASQCSFSDSGSQVGLSDSASQLGYSAMTNLATDNCSTISSGDDEKNEYRVFTDAGGGISIVGSDEALAKQLAQGVKILGIDEGGGARGGEGGKPEDDDDDSDSGESWEELGKPAVPTSFNLIEWDLPNEKTSKQASCNRVIIMKDKDMILMLKATCSTPKTGNNPALLSLMVDIADNCSKRLRKMKTLPKLYAQHMDTLPLSDGRTTKEHLIEISQRLGDNIGIKEVAYRFQPPGDVYIGTFVQGTVLAKRNYAIGKAGVVAVLYKKSKYATVEAFSEQLCEHIALTQPTTLGHLSDSDLKRLNRRGTTRIKHLQKDQLFVQNFIFDPTIIVAEAARRSFVRIDDFLLFK